MDNVKIVDLGRIRTEEREIDDCIKQIVASNRMEGMDTPVDEIEMLRKYMRGDIARDEYAAWASRKAGVTDAD